MGHDHEELTGKIIGLVRKKRIYEAQETLDAAVKNFPEFAASWFIMAKLLLLGGKEREKSVEKALGEYGNAPQKLFSEAMETLDGYEDSINSAKSQIERLSRYLQDIRSVDVHDATAPGESGHDAAGAGDVDKLNMFLRQVRGHEARSKLDVHGRTIGRLNRLAAGLARTGPQESVENPVVDKIKRLAL